MVNNTRQFVKAIHARNKAQVGDIVQLLMHIEAGIPLRRYLVVKKVVFGYGNLKDFRPGVRLQPMEDGLLFEPIHQSDLPTRACRLLQHADPTSVQLAQRVNQIKAGVSDY